MQEIRQTKAFDARPPSPNNSDFPLRGLAIVFNSLTLDVGRILAASIIFYFHVGLFRHCPLSAYGEYAVEYFVILSGVSYILFSTTKPSTAAELFNFIKRRLASLFPAFFLVNVVLYLGSYCYPSVLGRPYSFLEFLASTTGTSMYWGWKFMSTVMWFMPFIIQVYLLIPLVDRCARRINPVVLLLVAFCLSCLFSQIVPFFVHENRAATLVCKNWSPIFRLPEVCLGVILGHSVLARCDYWKGIIAVAVFGILSALASLYLSDDVFWFVYMPWGGFVVPVIILGASPLISPLLRAANTKLIRLLGLSSFFFYLIHTAPLAAIAHCLGNRISVWITYYLACWLCAVGFTLVFARVKRLVEVRLLESKKI
jgi:peptidoglycan/LPS O-acetylase OafA/YrhL